MAYAFFLGTYNWTGKIEAQIYWIVILSINFSVPNPHSPNSSWQP